MVAFWGLVSNLRRLWTLTLNLLRSALSPIHNDHICSHCAHFFTVTLWLLADEFAEHSASAPRWEPSAFSQGNYELPHPEWALLCFPEEAKQCPLLFKVKPLGFLLLLLWWGLSVLGSFISHLSSLHQSLEMLRSLPVIRVWRQTEEKYVFSKSHLPLRSPACLSHLHHHIPLMQWIIFLAYRDP